LRLLIVGCGDVGLRMLQAAPRGVALTAITSQPARVPELRARGARPLVADLDRPASLRRLAGIAQRVVHLAPPPGQGTGDPRTRALLHALARRGPPHRLVYVSTSGVYGDCGGEWVEETRPPKPSTPRALRRVAAEEAVHEAWLRHGVKVSVLRAPGIYAGNRPGGARERLLRGTPMLRAEDDVYTNHIHADDLARACWAALWRGRVRRSYNVSDDSAMRVGEYLDMAARLFGLPAPPRLARSELEGLITPMQRSFLDESRRLVNQRLKQELRVRLRYPTVADGLQVAALRA
jgi:nucleoside-diphosphate-sugar epimerase